MKNIFFIVFIILFLPCNNIAQEKENFFICKVKGEVINRPYSKKLLLLKESEHYEIGSSIIYIKDGKFEFEIKTNVEQAYSLIFEDEWEKGMWISVLFFAEEGEIQMQLYPKDEHYKNIIKGGILNTEYKKFQLLGDSIQQKNELIQEWEKLEEQNLIYTPESQKINIQLESVKDEKKRDSLFQVIEKLEEEGKYYTFEAVKLINRQDSCYNAYEEWKLNYIRENVNLVNFYNLGELIKREVRGYTIDIPDQVDVSSYAEIYYSKYEPAFLFHPYKDEILNLLDATSHIKVGGKYIDFTAPDMDDNMVTLSEQIEGKIALIDLWASWCGPCRSLSKTMIPIYEEYKDKGFTVVAIARERDKQNAEKAIKKDKYPWLNLLEIGDREKIWIKYGVFGGGRTFLVDQQGKILAIRPTAEEVRKILEEMIN